MEVIIKIPNSILVYGMQCDFTEEKISMLFKRYIEKECNNSYRSFQNNFEEWVEILESEEISNDPSIPGRICRCCGSKTNLDFLKICNICGTYL